MIIEYKNLMETNGTSFIGQGGDPGAKKWGAVSMGKEFYRQRWNGWFFMTNFIFSCVCAIMFLEEKKFEGKQNVH